MKPILYIRFRGTLGDACHYLLKMKDVCSAYPDHLIKCAIRSTNPSEIKQFIRFCPHIDKIEISPERDAGWSISQKFLLRIKSICDKGGSFLDFTLPGHGDVVKYISEKDWRPPLTEDDLIFAERFCKNFIGTQDLITIHIGSTRSKAPFWQWPIEKYDHLCKALLKNFSCKVLIVGDVQLPEKHKDIIDLTNNYNLGITVREIIALILKSRIVIGGDSGFSVISWLCGIPTISLLPEKHISEGEHNDYLSKGFNKPIRAPATNWLPKSYPPDNKNVILPLENTGVDELYQNISF